MKGVEEACPPYTFLAAAILEHSSAAPKSHKLLLLLLSALSFSTQLSLPQAPFHSLLGSPGYVLLEWVCIALSSDVAFVKPAHRWKCVCVCV